MEELLYIVLGAVWLIISYLGNKKRRQAQAQTQSRQEEEEYEPQEAYPQTIDEKPTSKQTEFEVLLDEFFGESTKTQTPRSQEVVADEVTVETDRKVFSEEDFQGYETYESEVADFSPATSLEKFKGSSAVSENYNFTYEGQSLESIDELIKAYNTQDRLAEENTDQPSFSGLESDDSILSYLDFDAKKAIIYSEIINRRYA